MVKIQVNIRKIIYFNCGERYEDMIDDRSYIYSSSTRIEVPHENEADVASFLNIVIYLFICTQL